MTIYPIPILELGYPDEAIFVRNGRVTRYELDGAHARCTAHYMAPKWTTFLRARVR